MLPHPVGHGDAVAVRRSLWVREARFQQLSGSDVSSASKAFVVLPRVPLFSSVLGVRLGSEHVQLVGGRKR